MMQIWLTVLIALLQLAFTAGGVYVVVKQTRRDLNGLGAKVGRVKEINDERYLAVCLAIMLLASDEKNVQIAAILHRDK
jgi:hypothetical protein